MTFQTFTGREYLEIDIASNFGLEKKKWAERLAWFNEHKGHLDEMLPQAAEPALYYAGVKAYRDMLAGEPIGYMISLDATSSGLQLLAALTGDRSAAELCNVVDTGNREDAYTLVYEEVLRILGDTAKISRDDTKQAIMTALYGSTAVPKQIFGEGAMLDTFFHTMREVAPAAWELNEAFLALWDPEALSNDWVLPDNFHVHIKVMDQAREVVHFLNQPFDVFTKVNRPIENGRSLGANTIHSIDGMIVREMSRRCDYDPAVIERVRQAISEPGVFTDDYVNADMVKKLWAHYEASGYLSARILDHLTDETILLVEPKVITELLDSLPAKPFKVVSIHDCFRVHPNYGNDLRKQYNIQLAMIARSNLLGYVISQLVHRDVEIGKLDETLAEAVTEANYALS